MKSPASSNCFDNGENADDTCEIKMNPILTFTVKCNGEYYGPFNLPIYDSGSPKSFLLSARGTPGELLPSAFIQYHNSDCR